MSNPTRRRPRAGEPWQQRLPGRNASWGDLLDLPYGTRLAGQPRLEMLLGHATKRTGGLSPDSHRRIGEVGQRDLLELDDPHVVRIGAGRYRVFSRLVAGLRQDSCPP